MEQRQRKRVQVEFPADFLGDLLAGEGLVLDLSTAGCRIKGELILDGSPYLQLLLHHPRHEVPIKVELAAVRWQNEQEFGLEFIRVSASQQANLRQLLKSLDMLPYLHRS